MPYYKTLALAKCYYAHHTQFSMKLYFQSCTETTNATCITQQAIPFLSASNLYQPHKHITLKCFTHFQPFLSILTRCRCIAMISFYKFYKFTFLVSPVFRIYYAFWVSKTPRNRNNSIICQYLVVSKNSSKAFYSAVPSRQLTFFLQQQQRFVKWGMFILIRSEPPMR